MSGKGGRHQNWPTERKVYVGGLSPDTSWHELKHAFRRFGKVEHCWVARRPPGFAFLLFADARAAEDACRGMNRRTIAGRRVRVEMFDGSKSRGSARTIAGRRVRVEMFDGSKSRGSARKPNPMPENWFGDLPANVISQILKFLDKPTRNVMLGMKGMRDVALAEPAFWREMTLEFEKEVFRKGSMVEKGEEMGALELISGFVQKVTLWIEVDDVDWISAVISRMPQFPHVTEVMYRFTYALASEGEPEKFAPSFLAFADHFEQVSTLKVSSDFMAQSMSVFESLVQKWDSLQEVEIGLDIDYLDDSLEDVTGSFGFARAVAESGKLVSLACHSGESSSAHLAIRDTLLALASRGHECLKTLHVQIPRAVDYGELFPFFLLNSLTTLKIGVYSSEE